MKKKMKSFRLHSYDLAKLKQLSEELGINPQFPKGLSLYINI
jgi:hypothetical protein